MCRLAISINAFSFYNSVRQNEAGNEHFAPIPAACAAVLAAIASSKIMIGHHYHHWLTKRIADLPV